VVRQDGVVQERRSRERPRESRPPGTRETQRIETRRRVFDAAVAEFRRAGTADADVGAIVGAAGVARGTFYFHYPTKEHVLVELEQQVETRIAHGFTRYTAAPHDLAGALAEVVRLVLASERHLGNTLFKDVLGLHFRSNQPASAQWADHPLIVAVIDEFERARTRGDIYPEADVLHSAMFFASGLYALLCTLQVTRAERAAVLDKYLAGVLRGLEPH
jgi:TetR/AcrR family transcriptional repressor of uid operon